MDAPTADFNLSHLERVVSGPGKIATLGDELARRGIERAIVVTGRTLGASVLLEQVTLAAGDRCIAVFKGALQHVPRRAVTELVTLVDRCAADALVSFGGGSPIDTCKAAAHAFLEKRALTHIAVPTTLSAGEYTHTAGVTDETTRVKSGISDARLQARLVINDPALSLETPPWLWAASGIRALDHAVESSYAIRHHPLSDALAAKAIALLVRHLPASLETRGPEQIARRGWCQTAAWFSIFGAMNTRFGLSHLLGHQIGPRWNVPHGVTSCITLPHAMRFMAGVAPERFGPIAEGFAVPFDPRRPQGAALACADRTAQLIAQLDVPRTLAEAGVPREQVEQIVGTVLHELERMGVVDRPLTQADLVGILEAAY